MRYIRFVKTPRFEGDTLKALVTVSSDLGDDFCSLACELIPLLTAVNNGGERQHTSLQTRKWNAGMRAAPITWTPSKAVLSMPGVTYSLTIFAVDVQTGARTVVNRLPGGGGGRRADAEFPLILSITSGEFSRTRQAGHECMRRFEVADGTELKIWEKSGDAIEAHIWYTSLGSKS